MRTELQKRNNSPITTSYLTERAVLVDLTLSRSSLTCTDREVSKKVQRDFNAAHASGRYTKNLFPQKPREVLAVTTIFNELMATYRRMTLPWDRAWRLMPRDRYDDFAREVAKARRELEAAVEQLVKAFPRLKQEAAMLLGRMYREEDYPTVDDLVEQHSIDVKFAPLADASDFRVALPEEALASLRKEYEASAQEAVRAAMSDVWARLHDALTMLRDACDREEKETKHGARVRVKSALIENTLQTAQDIGALNITNDQNLERVRKEVIAQVKRIDIEGFRGDSAVRETVKRNVDAILKKMGAYMPHQQ